jgi:hypothetical protein
MSYMAHILTEDSLTLFMDNNVFTITNNHPYWSDIVSCIKEGDWEGARDTIRAEEMRMEQYLNTKPRGNLYLVDGAVLYDNQPVHNFAVDRLLQMEAEGHNIDPMFRFLERLMANPSYSSREQLYGFLEANQLPITEDGRFLAYKLVREDYTDVYSGENDNHVGVTVFMPRNMVDDDPNRTCSSGLHFAGLEYLKHFWGERLVALKIDPKDVVSVPTDYNNSKGRCCRYTVVEELPMSLVESTTDYWTSAVV